MSDYILVTTSFQISTLKWSFQIHQNKNKNSIFPWAAALIKNFRELDILLNPLPIFVGTVCSAAWAHWPLYCQTAFVPVISDKPIHSTLYVFIVRIVLYILCAFSCTVLYYIINGILYCTVEWMWWMCCGLLHHILYCIFKS